MQRKIIILVIVIITILLGIFLFGKIKINKDGDISNVNISYGTSKLYSDAEIKEASQVILDYFKKEFKGCTLNSLSYAGDDYEDVAIRNNKEEVIVLISSFTTNSRGCDGSFNPNDEYHDWKWILVSNKNEAWVYVDHGLG